MGDAVAGVIRSRRASGAARARDRPLRWGNDDRTGSRSRSTACDAANRSADGTADNGPRNRAASRAGDSAVAVRDSHGWQGRNCQN
jgi:hypothetical protein